MSKFLHNDNDTMAANRPITIPQRFFENSRAKNYPLLLSNTPSYKLCRQYGVREDMNFNLEASMWPSDLHF